MKILHAADLHLDSPFGGLPPERARERRRESRELADRLAELEKVSGLPVPASLAALKDAPCRFPAVCRAGEMGEKVLEFLG